MWSPPFSRPTRRRRRIHINLADFYAPVELILASIAWPRFLRPPLADPPAGGIATMAATRARRLRADLTSSQPTKDDHRGNQIKQNGNRRATELACGCGVLKRWPLLVLEPSARTIAAWQRRTNVWHKATSPCEGAKRLRNRTANDGYSDEKMCPMSRKTRIRCPLP